MTNPYFPDFHYSFKSNFSFPNAAGGAALPGAGAAAAGPAASAAEALAAAPHTHFHGFGSGPGSGFNPGGGGIRGPYGWQGYHSYGPMRYRRPFFMRRFVWFGLGVGAATLYFRSRQRKDDANRDRYSSSIHGSGSAAPFPNTIGNPHMYPTAPWSSRNQDRGQDRSLLHSPSAPLAPVTAKDYQTSHATPVIPKSEVLESLAFEKSARQGVSQDASGNGLVENNHQEHKVEQEGHAQRRGWGWRHRRAQDQARAATARAEEESRLAESRNLTNEPITIANMVTPPVGVGAAMGEQEDELRKMHEVVEKIWELRKEHADVRERTHERSEDMRLIEQVREYAGEKLDRLSAALDTLRDSLKNDQNNRGGKLV